MSKEAWVLVGAVVGAFATGGIGLLRAILERRWSKGDAERAAELAWEQEKRDRLFEAKRSAHQAFNEALHRVRGITLEHQAPGHTSILDQPGFGPAMVELMHVHSTLQIYASRDAAEAAGEAGEAVGIVSDSEDGAEPEAVDQQLPYHRALAHYLHLARVDLGVEQTNITLDELKNLPSTDVDPGQSA